MKNITYIFIFIFVFQSNGQIVDFENVNFEKADGVALKYKNEKLSNLPELSYKLTSELTTDVERFRAIFKWVCSNVANDYGLYSRNMRKRQRFKDDSLKLSNWNDKFTKIVFRKLRRHNRTICTGYAYLVKELANLAGIECEIVHGFAKTSTINIKTLDVPNHSWNAVKLNGKWYLCDPTWASGIPNPKSSQFQFQFNGGFFLADPRLFAVNHYPADPKWLLLNSEKPSYDTFIENPIIYDQAYAYLRSHDAPKMLENVVKKNESVTFKFQLLKPVNKEDINFIIETSFNTRKVQPDSISIKNNQLTMEYAFKNTGFYDVHLYVKNDLISTYTYDVNR